jgi:AcrR family transcriptional regulator
MKKYSQPVQRKPRTDALRNQKRILEAAKGAFTRYGADASLDDIAKQAGVGAGTLYRHFPTRDALIEAVYRSEVEKLAAAARGFPAAMPPIEALRAWLLLFVDYFAAKHIIVPALHSVAGALPGSMRVLAAWSREQSKSWSSARKRAAMCEEILTPSICFGR